MEGDGKLTVWRIENMVRVEVPPELHGQFSADSSYTVLYSYKIKGKGNAIVYFWQGRQSSTDEHGASALLTVLDEELGGGTVPPVHVSQGKEPGHFLALFKGRLVIN